MSRLSKDALIHHFRGQRGLHYFGEHRGTTVVLSYTPPLPILPTPKDNSGFFAEVSIDHYRFDLCWTSIGDEKWAFVLCDNQVIVPPFKWLGWEFLSAHVW